MQDSRAYYTSCAKARAAGHAHYYTGKPCKRGHVAARFASTRMCCMCSAERNASPDLIEYRRKYYAARYAAAPAEHLARGKAYNKTQIGRASTWVRAARRRASKVEAEGQHTAADLAVIRFAQRDCCANCGKKLHGRGSLDHIQALSKGGSNWPTNLQWLCRSCNSRKHTKDAIAFAQAEGRLL